MGFNHVINFISVEVFNPFKPFNEIFFSDIMQWAARWIPLVERAGNG